MTEEMPDTESGRVYVCDAIMFFSELKNPFCVRWFFSLRNLVIAQLPGQKKKVICSFFFALQ